MLPPSPAQCASSLRAINHRISSTPTKQLPSSAPQIAASLWGLKSLLSASQDAIKANAELSTLVHRFRTTLSSLLLDRTVEGRWAGLVLLKAAIEAGGNEAIVKSGSWVKSLLAILKKPDPPTTRILAVVLLTRIFLLTRGDPNLVREITTPALPTFVNSCLNNVEHRRASAEELSAVLEAFATLIPRHPTIFRTSETRIRKLLAPVISDHPSNDVSNLQHGQSQVRAAQRLFALLHHCAAKQGGAEHWAHTLEMVIATAHETCDHLFKAVMENRAWSARPANSELPASRSREPMTDDVLHLKSWHGVYPGAERLTTILGIIKSHLELATTFTVKLPIGRMFGLISRLLGVTVPRSGGSNTVEHNAEVSKDEREALFSALPGIQIATLQLVDTMLARFGTNMTSTAQGLCEVVAQLFNEEQTDSRIRMATYQTLRQILEIVGPSMSEGEIADVVPVVSACCSDLSPTDQTGSLSTNSAVPHVTCGVSKASAEVLLPVLFRKINQTYLPRKCRIRMERTAILTRHREALVACVMNPWRKDSQAAFHPSLMPFLARLFHSSAEVEVLLRPRMPVVMSRNRAAEEVEDRDTIENENANSLAMSNGDNHGPPSDAFEPTAYQAEPLDMVETIALEPHDAEDLYSSTPQPSESKRSDDQGDRGADGHVGWLQKTKRLAADAVDSEMIAKRSRVSPTGEAPRPEVVSSGQQALPADSGKVPTTVETPSVLDQVAVAATLPGATEGNVWPTMTGLEKGSGVFPAGGGSDDEDLEIPEINAEADTDSGEE